MDDLCAAMILCGCFAVISYRLPLVDYVMRGIRWLVELLNDDQMPRPPLAPAGHV